MKRRLLAISFHFPPRPGVASSRVARLVRHLPEHGWMVDVVAATPGREVDQTLLDGLGSERIVRVPAHPLVPRLQRADWAAAAFGPARRLAREADAVLISGGPFAPFLLGRMLRRPYVLDLRDPWSWEPRFGRLEPRLRRRLGNALERRAEWLALSHAAAILTVAPEIASEYERRRPGLRGSIETLRHSFEPADFAGPSPEPPAEPELVYAGSFLTGERTPELVVETARRVRGAGPPLRVQLVGDLPAELRSMTATAEAEGWLECTGRLSAREAIAAMRRASVLWAQPGELPFLVTGKAPEYLATGRPIVAAARADGALANLLEKTGGAIVVPPEAEACAVAVEAALAGKVAPARPEAIEALAAPHAAARLAEILDGIAR
jgi:glycosyltransferase involved in cell wall biosynthesis